MSGISADLELDIGPGLNAVDELDARFAEVVAGFGAGLADALSSVSGEAIPVTADAATITGSIEEAVDAADATVTVEADTTTAEEAVGSLTEQTVELGGAGREASGGIGAAATSAQFLGSASAGAGAGVLGLSRGMLQAGGVVAGLGLGFGALASGVSASIDAYSEAAGVAAITTQIIENQGERAFITAEGVANLASGIQEYSGISDEAIASGANFVLSLGNVRNQLGEGNDVFDRTITLTADFARRTGGDATAAATSLGRALSDPERGLSRLERTVGRFPAAQREMILSLAESGDLLGAQTALLDVLESRIGGVARAYGESLPGQLDRAKEAVGEAAESIGEQLAPVALEFAGFVRDELAPALEEAAPLIADFGGRAVLAAEGVLAVAGAVLDFTTAVEKVIGSAGGNPLDTLFGGGLIDSQAIDEAVNSTEVLIATNESAGQAEQNRAGALRDMTNAGESAADNFRDQADAAAELSTQASELSDKLDALFGAEQSVAEGSIDLRDQQRQLFEAFLEMDGRYVAQTASGDAFLSQLQDQAQGIRTQTLALLETEDGAAKARAAQDLYIGGLREIAEAAGLPEREIRELIRTQARVSEREITAFETPGLDRARRETQGLDRDTRHLPSSVRITIYSNALSVAHDFDVLKGSIDNAGAAAAGGLFDFHGTASNPSGAPGGEPDAFRVRASGVSGSGAGTTTIVDATSTLVLQGDVPERTVTRAESALADHRRKLSVLTAMR